LHDYSLKPFLTGLALKHSYEVDALADQVANTFKFDMKVWKHECSTICMSTKTVLLARRVREKLKLLELREKNKFDTLQALEHAIETRDAKAIEACLLKCSNLGLEDSTKLRAAKHLMEDLQMENERREMTMKILEHAMETKSIDLLVSSLKQADKVSGISLNLLENAKSLLSYLEYVLSYLPRLSLFTVLTHFILTVLTHSHTHAHTQIPS
jgi:hypothetical protein